MSVESSKSIPFDACYCCETKRIWPSNCLVVCDHCYRSYHQSCEGFALKFYKPDESSTWYCRYCRLHGRSKLKWSKFLLYPPVPWSENFIDLYQMFNDFPSQAYLNFLKKTVSENPDFYFVFQFLQMFAEPLKINLSEFSLAVLEEAFATPMDHVKGLLADVHVPLLHLLKANRATTDNWYHVVGDALVDDELESIFHDVVKLRKTMKKNYLNEKSLALARASIDEENYDDMIETAAYDEFQSGADERRRLHEEKDAFRVDEDLSNDDDIGFEYFKEPIGVRLLFLRRMCEETMTTKPLVTYLSELGEVGYDMLRQSSKPFFSKPIFTRKVVEDTSISSSQPPPPYFPTLQKIVSSKLRENKDVSVNLPVGLRKKKLYLGLSLETQVLMDSDYAFAGIIPQDACVSTIEAVDSTNLVEKSVEDEKNCPPLPNSIIVAVSADSMLPATVPGFVEPLESVDSESEVVVAKSKKNMKRLRSSADSDSSDSDFSHSGNLQEDVTVMHSLPSRSLRRVGVIDDSEEEEAEMSDLEVTEAHPSFDTSKSKKISDETIPKLDNSTVGAPQPEDALLSDDVLRYNVGLAEPLEVFQGDPRSLDIYLFEDSLNAFRLVRLRRTLPFESTPMNASVRSHLMQVCRKQAVLEYFADSPNADMGAHSDRLTQEDSSISLSSTATVNPLSPDSSASGDDSTLKMKVEADQIKVSSPVTVDLTASESSAPIATIFGSVSPAIVSKKEVPSVEKEKKEKEKKPRKAPVLPGQKTLFGYFSKPAAAPSDSSAKEQEPASESSLSKVENDVSAEKSELIEPGLSTVPIEAPATFSTCVTPLKTLDPVSTVTAGTGSEEDVTNVSETRESVSARPSGLFPQPRKLLYLTCTATMLENIQNSVPRFEVLAASVEQLESLCWKLERSTDRWDVMAAYKLRNELLPKYVNIEKKKKKLGMKNRSIESLKDHLYVPVDDKVRRTRAKVNYSELDGDF